MRKRSEGTLVKAVVVLALGWVTVSAVRAEASLSDNLIPNLLKGGDGSAVGAIAPIPNIIAVQVANQIPTLSTSAGFTYEYNEQLDVWERSAKTFGPLFTERAVTVGKQKFNANVAYTYIRFNSLYGHDLDHLTNKVEVATDPNSADPNKPIYFGFFRGATFSDGSTGAVGDRITLDYDIEAQLVDFSFTYGIIDDLDVNIDIPVIRTYVRTGDSELLPDPRCVGVDGDCDKSLVDFGGFTLLTEDVPGESSLGVGDVHLRAKYVAVHDPVNVGALLDFAMATGSKEDFQGTEDWRLGTIFVASREVTTFLDAHMQGGVEFNINTVQRSQARYAAGLTAQVGNIASLTLDFIGRSEFAAQGRVKNIGRLPAVRNGELAQPAAELADPDAFKGRPFFIDVQRNDIFDLALGTKVAIGPVIVFANVLLPLNNDGLRADFIPTGGVEATF